MRFFIQVVLLLFIAALVSASAREKHNIYIKKGNYMASLRQPGTTTRTPTSTSTRKSRPIPPVGHSSGREQNKV